MLFLHSYFYVSYLLQAQSIISFVLGQLLIITSCIPTQMLKWVETTVKNKSYRDCQMISSSQIFNRFKSRTKINCTLVTFLATSQKLFSKWQGKLFHKTTNTQTTYPNLKLVNVENSICFDWHFIISYFFI